MKVFCVPSGKLNQLSYYVESYQQKKSKSIRFNSWKALKEGLSSYSDVEDLAEVLIAVIIGVLC